MKKISSRNYPNFYWKLSKFPVNFHHISTGKSSNFLWIFFVRVNENKVYVFLKMQGSLLVFMRHLQKTQDPIIFFTILLI